VEVSLRENSVNQPLDEQGIEQVHQAAQYDQGHAGRMRPEKRVAVAAQTNGTACWDSSPRKLLKFSTNFLANTGASCSVFRRPRSHSALTPKARNQQREVSIKLCLALFFEFGAALLQTPILRNRC